MQKERQQQLENELAQEKLHSLEVCVCVCVCVVRVCVCVCTGGTRCGGHSPDTGKT